MDGVPEKMLTGALTSIKRNQNICLMYSQVPSSAIIYGRRSLAIQVLVTRTLVTLSDMRYLSKTSQIIFDLHPGFFHMEDEKGNKLHLLKKYFKMMFFTIQVIIDPYCYSF